jgi:hypothetical protein
MLGVLVAETTLRYLYRRRTDGPTAFVDKRSPAIHVAPCEACTDYQTSELVDQI